MRDVLTNCTTTSQLTIYVQINKMTRKLDENYLLRNMMYLCFVKLEDSLGCFSTEKKDTVTVCVAVMNKTYIVKVHEYA